MSAPFVHPAQLRQVAWDDGTYHRGLAYFRAGAVLDLDWDADERTLRSTVRGSGPNRYHCSIEFEYDDRVQPVAFAECTCPVGTDCKHTVATLLASNAQVAGTPSAEPGQTAEPGLTEPTGPAVQPEPTAQPEPTTPKPTAQPVGASWRELLAAPPTAASTHPPLALGVELQRLDRGGRAWAPRRAQTALPRDILTHRDDLRIALRPLVRSDATGKWIRGTASWDLVRRGGPFDPQHARWFAELYAISYHQRPYYDSADWITLDTIDSALLWPHLTSAAAAGILLVPAAKNQTVTLAHEAAAAVEVASSADGGLALNARFHIDGATADAASIRPIAHSGICRITTDGETIALTLAPIALSDPLLRLVDGGGSAIVPPSDTQEFLRDAYPRLARRTPVAPGAGVQLPEPEPPTLTLRAAYRRGDTVEYALEWEYPGLGRHPYPAADQFDRDQLDRDPAAEAPLRQRVEQAWAAAADTLPFADAAVLHGVDTAVFTSRLLPALKAAGVRIEQTGSPRAYEELTAAPEITVSTVESPDPDWFDLGVIVTIEGRSIPFTPLFTALAKRQKRILLADGRHFSLAHPALDRLRELIDEAAALAEWETGPRISRYQTALWADFEDLADVAEPAVSWRATAAGLRDATGIPVLPPPAALDARLRPYQQAGFEWLAFLWRHRLGGILADDMGLGKTVQLLALIAHTREHAEGRPFLVVAPTSVLATWTDEAARFAPTLRVRSVHATGSRRGGSVSDAATDADVVITSYTLLRLDAEEFQAVSWAGVILDEAQFVKNPQTKVHAIVRDLPADITLAVTGTPLENSLSELWALLALTAPGLFPSARRFREEYIKPIEQGRVPENEEGGPFRAARLQRLRRRIRPLVLRRTKEQVATELPPKQEQELRIELSPAHRAIYDRVLQRERQKVLGLLDDLDRNRFIVFRSLTLLRMLSLSPGLVDPANARVTSSKLDALVEQLTEVVGEGHRALVFSQFTSFLGMAAQRLSAAGIAHAYLDGSTRRRSEVIAGFREGAAPVFLISLKAGGFGLTLTEADYVFLLDPWWNPAAEAQAVDRTHRIGQTRSVMVYRLIAQNTIEEKVMALQRRKARLFHAVMDDGEVFGKALTADDIRGLLEE